MVTTVEGTIGGTSPDYSTITLWESDTDDDLVSADEIQKGLCRAASFDENIVFAGATTDATRYRWLTVDDGVDYAFKSGAGSGPRIEPSSSGHATEIDEDQFHIEGLEIAGVESDSDECIRISVSDTELWIRNMLLHPGTPDTSEDGIYTYWDNDDLTVNVENVVIYDFSRRGIHIQIYSDHVDCTQTWNLRNVTIYGSDGLFLDSGDGSSGNVFTFNIENSLIEDFDADGVVGTVTLNLDDSIFGNDPSSVYSSATVNETNVTDSATFTTSTASSAVIFTSLTGGGEDFHLTDHANNLAIEYGSDLSEFTDDADGDTRVSGSWDAGADQVTLGGGDVDLTQPDVDTVEVAAFDGTVKADQSVTQTAVDTVAVASFDGAVAVDRNISQPAMDEVEVASFDGTVQADLAITQTAVDTVDIAAFDGTVKADQSVTQTAIDEVEIASFDGSVNVGVNLEQTAVDTVEVAAFDGTVKADQSVSQPAIDEVEIAALSGSVNVGLSIDQGAVAEIEVTANSGTVKADQDIDQPAIDEIEIAALSGTVQAGQQIAQPDVDTVEIVSFDGTVVIGGDVDLTQTATETVEISSFDGTVSSGLSLEQGAVATVELAVSSGLLWTREYGEEWLYTAASWLSYDFYFEAYMSASTGTVWAAMFNASTMAIVPESMISSASSSFERVRSAELTTLVDGTGYVVGVGRQSGSAGLIRGGHVVAAPTP